MADLAPAEGPILDTILAATHQIWSEGLSTPAYKRFYAGQTATRWGAQRLRRLALVDGSEVLASAKLYEFDATLDGTSIRVVGLGAVFTQPRHRGGGHASDLIERLMARAADDGIDVAMLFSEIGERYYERLGFRTVPTKTLTLRVSESKRRGAPATLVRAMEDRDIPAIVAINETRARGYRFHLNRDRDLVQYAISKKRLLAGLGPAGLREVQLFVAEEGATAVAYVFITAKHEGKARAWVLEECGDRDPSGARVGAILQTLIARDPAEARPAITAWLPPGFQPPQIEIVAAVPSADAMMVRPLSGRAKSAPPLVEADVLYWKADHF